MKKMFPLGCAGLGIQNSSLSKPVSLIEPGIEQQFEMLKAAEVWDFMDRIPLEDSSIDAYIKASQEYNLPINSGCGVYILGKDEQLFKDNIERSIAVGAKFHNLMVWAKHADGHYLSNEEVAESYLELYEYAQNRGVTITYENHVDMWSEDPRRVSIVADLVEARGVAFDFAMDYSHCIFKIENEEELAVSGIRNNYDAARKLDPYNSDSYADQWLNRNIVNWMQVRPAVPNNPLNWWALSEAPYEGLGIERPGRGIQYPFKKPEKGEWHTDFWHAHKLAATKEVIKKAIDSYLSNPDSKLKLMTVDNINLLAYGLGWKYDMFEDSCTVAKFIREIYAERAAVFEAKQQAKGDFIFQYRTRLSVPEFGDNYQLAPYM